MLHKLAAVTLLLQCKTVLAAADGSSSDQVKTIDTDVTVVGGGVTGTYAAVRLREDYNTSIVVIETRDHLGGHTSTYTEPTTNTPIDYGVQSYIVTQAAKDFFARFNISTPPFSTKRLTPLNVDTETGADLRNYVAPSLNATTSRSKNGSASSRITKVGLSQDTGISQRRKTSPRTPPPLEDFVKQNDIEAALPRIITISGIGELLRPIGSNSILYQRAFPLLKDDVLLSATVSDVERSKSGSIISVTSAGQEYKIKAKCILFAAAPSISNLAPYHLDTKEIDVFDKWAISGE